VYHGDFRELDVIQSGSAKLVFTDPPYEHTALPLWEALSQRAAEWLVDGGVLLSYSGLLDLPEVLASLGTHLRYWWTMAMLHGYDTNTFPTTLIQMAWRPALMFVKGDYKPSRALKDCIMGQKKVQTLHPYEQSLFEARYYIEALTQPGDLVVDPFCGSGTVAVACKETGRRFVGCEIKHEWVVTAQERLGQIAA
jgi:site-specific DNA-methyltransferase (adenine-specific)